MSDTFTRTILASRLEPGAQLNDTYTIDERIASGGMGEVYRGHNIETGEPVAIKIILPEFADEGKILALFRREATILGRLHHDAIVRYYSFSRDPRLDRRYLAMEFVGGISLADRIATSPLTPEEVRRLFASVAEGLALAHESGVVHRDLSPDNIILRNGDIGRPKLIDFGIARDANFSEGTLIGDSFAGKYNFVSPEQLGVRNREVDGRSDIYSLGLVIAASLRGRPLDMGGSHADIIEKRSRVPDLSGIDDSLRPLLEAMLQPHPEDRPGSAMMVADWLRTLKQQGDRPMTAQAEARQPTDSESPGIPDGDAGADTIEREFRSRPVEAVVDPVAIARQEELGRIAGGREVVPSSLDPTPVSRAAAEHKPARRYPSKALYGAAFALLAALLGGLWYLFGPDWRGTSGDQTTVPRNSTEPSGQPSATEPAGAGRSDSDGGTGPTNDKQQRDASDQSQDRYARVASFIKNYAGGDCFVAVPAMSAGKTQAFQTFAQTETSHAKFRQGLRGIDEQAIKLSRSDVAASQCPALSFAKSAMRYPEFSLRIDLGQTEIANGGKLSGSVLNVNGRELHLLLIDDEGQVQSVDRYLLASGGTSRTFDVPLFLTGNSVATKQILMAIASDPPIPGLDAVDEPAGTFFPRLSQEVRTLSADVDLGVDGFELLQASEKNPASP